VAIKRNLVATVLAVALFALLPGVSRAYPMYILYATCKTVDRSTEVTGVSGGLLNAWTCYGPLTPYPANYGDSAYFAGPLCTEVTGTSIMGVSVDDWICQTPF
jgi:hypothetical protein